MRDSTYRLTSGCTSSGCTAPVAASREVVRTANQLLFTTRTVCLALKARQPGLRACIILGKHVFYTRSNPTSHTQTATLRFLCRCGSAKVGATWRERTLSIGLTTLTARRRATPALCSPGCEKGDIRFAKVSQIGSMLMKVDADMRMLDRQTDPEFG